MDTSTTPIVTQEHAAHTGLAVVQRYEGAVNYLYSLLLNMSHKHRVLRDQMIGGISCYASDQCSPPKERFQGTPRQQTSRNWCNFSQPGVDTRSGLILTIYLNTWGLINERCI